MLSKSRYLKGLKCEKALWLNKFKKEEAFYEASTQQVFDLGNTAGILAQQYFPNGALALVVDFPDKNAALKTQELIANGTTTIYEATFIAHNTLIALDILHQIDGKWHAFEVKSTNSAKPEHIRDAAIQHFVMTAAGIEIADISIMHFDRDYIKNGAIEPEKLFTYQSVLDDLQKHLPEIPGKIERFMAVYQKEEPTILMGGQCDEPYPCEFANYCATLKENQQLLTKDPVAIESSNEIIYEDKEAIQQFLVENPYPIYSLDFESAQYGIPVFDNSRPYQQIPLQFSLHYQKDKNATPQHFEFLGNGIDDPREALIQKLIEVLYVNDSTSKILMYSSFEKTMLRDLMRDYPNYKKELENIKSRLIDLGVVFRKFLKTKATKKTWSLKVVLPSFLPQYSYQNLDIQDGLATVDVYKTFATLPVEEQHTKRLEMLAYCKLDTFAVLELYNHLYEID